MWGRHYEKITLSLTIFSLLMFYSIQGRAGDLAIPNFFSQGDTVSAGTMNDNFSAIESAVNENAVRINNLESNSTRTLSIPAWALSHDEGTGIITKGDGGSLTWFYNSAAYARTILRSPADYAGGDVNFYIFFVRTSLNEGTVNFLLDPASLSSGGTIQLSGAVPSLGVTIAGSTATVFEQVITIPADRFAEDWWFIKINRDDSAATYTDAVLVLSIALEYYAVQ